LAFSNQWSLGAEYLYVDLGDTTLALAASVPGPTATAFRASAATFENTSHIARAKLNFRFSAR
jgi:opacity protein-like surface antigen